MDKIKELYNDVKDHSTALHKLKDLECEIRDTNRAIGSLEQSRVEIRRKIASLDIESVERELKSIQSQIANTELSEMEILDVESLLKMASLQVDPSLVLCKATSFIDSCIRSKLPREVKGVEDGVCAGGEHWKADLQRSSNIAVVSLEKCLERVLHADGSAELGASCRSHVLQKLRDTFRCFDFSILEIHDCATTVDLCFSTPRTDPHYEGTGAAKVSPLDFGRHYPLLFSVFEECIKDTLLHALRSGCFEYRTLSAFMDCFRETSLYVQDLENWALDVLLKEIIRVSRNGDKIVVQDSRANNNVKFYRESVGRMGRIYCKVYENRSDRKEKALEISKRALQKHLARLMQSTSVDDLFVTFNSILHLETKAASTDIAHVCVDAKEAAFLAIINESALRPEHYTSVADAMIHIKKTISEFFDAIAKFLDEKRQRFFKITFFEKSFSNFIQHVYGLQTTSRSDAETLGIIGEYVMSQCVLPPRELSNYNKMACLTKILSSTPLKKTKVELLDVFAEDELRQLAVVVPWCKEPGMR